jgi:AbrB family looped-hinge helix DNA binding protein
MEVPVKFKIKAVKVGNSTRMTIPKEITEHLHINAGDTLSVWVDNNHMIVEKKV